MPEAKDTNHALHTFPFRSRLQKLTVIAIAIIQPKFPFVKFLLQNWPQMHRLQQKPLVQSRTTAGWEQRY
jgi:hypothetical protein